MTFAGKAIRQPCSSPQAGDCATPVTLCLSDAFYNVLRSATLRNYADCHLPAVCSSAGSSHLHRITRRNG